MSKHRDVFREMYGDELADLVEQLKKRPTGVEVFKPKPKKQPEREPEPHWQDD